MGTAVPTDAKSVQRESTTHDRLKHYCLDREKVRRAIVERTPVEALCGKVWVPTRWQPADAQRCAVCVDLLARIYPWAR